jgi:exodeoxyribonuclease VII large subunit
VVIYASGFLLLPEESVSPEVIGVKEFIAILNETLGFAYPSVTIEGEVSSFKVNQGKWVFFDLKEADATLGCFMPLSTLKVELEDGMKVRVSGYPRLTKWGRFSFTVRSVELAGEGALKRAYELLRARLDEEGLFSDSRKRTLVAIPTRVGLVASRASAAYSDFVQILQQRWRGVDILLADVQVQGAAAPVQIVGAIDYFNELADPVDTLVIIRGGGSLEDLQAFNTEIVARAVAGSRTPTIVGVGHEVDVSLADLAADRRAATPTDAARIVVPDRVEMERRLGHQLTNLENRLLQRLGHWQHTVSKRLSVLQHQINAPRGRVQYLNERLGQFLTRTAGSLHLQRQRLDHVSGGLYGAQSAWLQGINQRHASLRRVLRSYDPTATLKRGYAIVRQQQTIIKSPKEADPNQDLVIQLAAGKMKARVSHD